VGVGVTWAIVADPAVRRKSKSRRD